MRSSCTIYLCVACACAAGRNQACCAEALPSWWVTVQDEVHGTIGQADGCAADWAGCTATPLLQDVRTARWCWLSGDDKYAGSTLSEAVLSPSGTARCQSNLMASQQQPLFLQGKDSVEGYFPSGKWYSLFDNSTLDASDGGRRMTVELPLGEVGVHVKVNC